MRPVCTQAWKKKDPGNTHGVVVNLSQFSLYALGFLLFILFEGGGGTSTLRCSRTPAVHPRRPRMYIVWLIPELTRYLFTDTQVGDPTGR